MANIVKVLQDNAVQNGQQGRIVLLDNGQKMFLVGNNTPAQSGVNPLQGTGYGSIFDALNTGISAFTPSSSLFSPQLSSNFLDEASKEVSPYYDKQLQIALKQLDLAKQQATESKNLSESQQQQNINQFQKQEDFNFTNTLRNAQNGYAGRGTFNSGIQNRGIQNLQTSEQTNVVDPFNLQQQQNTENRNLGFSQFLGTNELNTENAKYQNELAKNNAIQQTARSIQTAEQAKQNYGVSALGNAFSQFLGNNQRLSA